MSLRSGSPCVLHVLLLAFKLPAVSTEVELQGLDLPEMGTLGYPTDWEPSDIDEKDLQALPGKE